MVFTLSSYPTPKDNVQRTGYDSGKPTRGAVSNRDIAWAAGKLKQQPLNTTKRSEFI